LRGYAKYTRKIVDNGAFMKLLKNNLLVGLKMYLTAEVVAEIEQGLTDRLTSMQAKSCDNYN
jgi:hypothetical protein